MRHFASPSFWECYRNLPPSIQDLADRSFELLKANPKHPSLHLKKAGKYKAHLFAAALGMTRDDAEDLRDALLQAVKTHDMQLGRRDEYGQRYIVDFMLEWRGQRAMIRSSWIIEHGSDTPRLTSCYPL